MFGVSTNLEMQVLIASNLPQPKPCTTVHLSGAPSLHESTTGVRRNGTDDPCARQHHILGGGTIACAFFFCERRTGIKSNGNFTSHCQMALTADGDSAFPLRFRHAPRNGASNAAIGERLWEQPLVR